MRYKIAVVVLLLFFTLPLRAQWQVISHISASSTQGVQTFASDGRVLFAGTGELGLLKSIDSGRTWTVCLADQGIVSVLCDDGNVYAGLSRNGLLRSHDLGATWPDTLRRSGEIKYIKRLGNNLVYSVFGGGVNVSSDNGANWTIALDAGFSSIIATNGRDAYANADKGFYHSSDFGFTWQKMGSVPGGLYDLAIVGNRLFVAVGSAATMISSADSGKTWTTTSNGFPNNALLYIHRFGVVGNSLVAGTNQGAYVSSDLGANWTTFSSGISDPYLWAVVPALGYVYSGDTQIIRIPASQIPQSKKSVLSGPTSSLSSIAAYPNPCNRDLNIDYSLQTDGLVTIKIFDFAGRVILTETHSQTEGKHSYQWRIADGTVQGIYTCLICSNGKTQSVKFVVE